VLTPQDQVALGKSTEHVVVPMYYAADREKAQRAVTELRAARIGDKSQALAYLKQLRNELASDRSDRARLEAWEAILTLYEAFKDRSSEDLTPLWDDAISKTEAWRASLR
jgi:uncharacterized protein HemY